MFLRLGNVGWYVVTKGRIFFRTLTVCCKADFPSEFAIKSIDLASAIWSSIKLRRRQITKIQAESFDIYSLARTKNWNMALLPKPVGKTAKTSFPLKRLLTAATCSGFRLTDFPLCGKTLAVSRRANSKELSSTTAIFDLIWALQLSWSIYCAGPIDKLLTLIVLIDARLTNRYA